MAYRTAPSTAPLIRSRHIVAGFVGLYLVAAVAYGLTLELTSQWHADDTVVRMAIDYSLKGVLSLGLAFLAFRVLAEQTTQVRVGVIALLALPFAFAWQWLYYFVTDVIGIGHLGPVGKWWDIYIPLLFYGVQFAFLFAAHHHNLSVRNLQRAEELRRVAQHSELAALKAQVNPHFLFNTLNAISASLPPEREDTRELMSRLADLFRYQVVASQRETVPLSRELDFVRDYLTLARARMGDRLRFDVEVGPGVFGEAPILPMLLQPLVENAIKHGLSPKLEGGHLALEISRGDGQLHVEVRDDGVGFSVEASASPFGDPAPPPGATTTAAGTGVGLSNTRRRLALVYGADLFVASSPGGGTRVRFSIPLPDVRREAIANKAAPAVGSAPAPQPAAA